MPLLSKSIPNLLGGVSQQADAVRYDNQCEGMDNAFPSILDGLIKRPPTEHVVKSNHDHEKATDSYFTHTLSFDDDEKYALIVDTETDPPVIKVYHLDEADTAGRTVTVAPDASALDYLKMGAGYLASKDLKAITIADYTFIVNKSKTVAFTSDKDPIRDLEGLLYIRDGEYGTSYTATLEVEGGSTYKTVVTTPSGNQMKEFDDQGNLKHKTFDARDAIDTTVIAEAFLTGTGYGFNSHQIPNNASSDEGTIDGGTVAEWKDGVTLGPVDPVFGGPVSTHAGDKVTFTTTTLFTNSNRQLFKSKLKEGDKFYVTGSAEAGNNNTVFVADVDSTDTLITVSGGLTESSGGVAEAGVIILKLPPEAPDAGTDITDWVAGTVGGIRNATDVTKSNIGSVVWLRSATVTFTLATTDGLSDKASRALTNEIERLSFLPSVAPHGYFVKVIGNADSHADDYYVTFKADDGVFSSGSWSETRQQDLEYKLDKTTMPHALIRHANGEFTFTPFDAGTVDGTVIPAWSERLCGDEDSNPAPTFVGRTLADIFLYKNRLGLLSDENVLLSETAEFFNFFRTTILSLLDTAPIDVASTHSSVSLLTSAIPFSNQLVLFSNQNQFLLGSGSSALSPSTINMTRTTSYDSVTDIRPLSLGNSIYFGFSRGDYVGLRQYQVTSNTESIFDAEDISIQIPQYIKGSLRHITGSSHEDVLFVAADGNRNHLYCYKFFDNPSGGRVQSAWSRFIFEKDDEIIGVSFIDTTLYIVTKRPDGIFIDKMKLESGLVDSGLNYRTLLDRRITEEDVTFDGEGTTLTLPYKAHEDSSSNMVVELYTSIGRQIDVTATNDSADIVVPEDLSGTDFFVGIKYPMEYVFSDVVLRENTIEDTSTLMSQGRKQVRYLTLDYHDTSFFKIQVTPLHRSTSTHPFTGRILGAGENILGQIHLDSGQFRVPVYSSNTEVSIVLLNDSALPCAITGVEFELTYSPRSKRFS